MWPLLWGLIDVAGNAALGAFAAMAIIGHQQEPPRAPPAPPPQIAKPWPADQGRRVTIEGDSARQCYVDVSVSINGKSSAHHSLIN